MTSDLIKRETLAHTFTGKMPCEDALRLGWWFCKPRNGSPKFARKPLETRREGSFSLSHKLMSTESVMPSNHLILCHPLLFLPSIFLSTRVFSNESVLPIRWPKYWIFSFSINPSNEYSGLISFRIDWLDLLVIQGNLRSLLQHHSLKASILWCSAFFIIQLSHPCMTTGKP